MKTSCDFLYIRSGIDIVTDHEKDKRCAYDSMLRKYKYAVMYVISNVKE